uniref:Disease resistance protein RGA3 n=1 Tax=Aegilops tauschii subsp. strangulata TaxID=200361 RepID=A0A453J977_AEGTS
MAAILGSLVGTCAKRLQEIITEEAVLILGVNKGLRDLQRTMTQIQCFLNDAEERRTEESAVNNWLGELKDAMYYADDIIDLVRFEGGKLLAEHNSSSTKATECGGISFFTCIPSCKKRHDIAIKIRDFNGELEKISELGAQFLKLQSMQHKAEAPLVKQMRTCHLVEPNLVGKETLHACTRLVELVLRQEDKKAYKVGITGTGGVGKTTLAQKICNDQKIKGAFSNQAWICVSQEYSEVALLKEVLRNFGVHQEQGETVGELSSKLAEAIRGKSFFLVLDDVWQSQVRTNLLRVPLHAAATGVILVTTRHDTVAHVIGVEDVHRVELMALNVGWELLWKSMNINQENDVQNLRHIGLEIVRKCGGLPLAIKVTASVLATKERTQNEWRKIMERSAWSMCNLPIELRGALYLSYDDLPRHLKQCLLYLILYPEDQYMYRDYLIRLWVAEGFVEEHKGQLLEDTAEEYYYELIYRNLLQLDPLRFDRSMCKMHDLLRQLAQHFSRDENYCDCVGGLIHLRLLDLDETAISCLPESIGSLTNLQVPKGIGKLEFLNDLEGFPIGGTSDDANTQDGWKLEELGHLSQLRQLDMIKLERAAPSTTNSLFLRDKKYPTWLGTSIHLSSTTYLNLTDCTYCAHLPAIWQLASL